MGDGAGGGAAAGVRTGAGDGGAAADGDAATGPGLAGRDGAGPEAAGRGRGEGGGVAPRDPGSCATGDGDGDGDGDATGTGAPGTPGAAPGAGEGWAAGKYPSDCAAARISIAAGPATLAPVALRGTTTAIARRRGFVGSHRVASMGSAMAMNHECGRPKVPNSTPHGFSSLMPMESAVPVLPYTRTPSGSFR